MDSSALVPASPTGLAAGPFGHTSYTIKRPFWTFLGREFRVFSPDGTLVMYVKHPMMKLRDEWKVYTDDSQKDPLITIKAREVIAINITSDVTDAKTGQKVGTIRSKGLKSILRDTWEILGDGDQPIGLMQEDSLAILRRLFPILMGKWHAEINGTETARIRQVFRFFTKEFVVDITPGQMDPRMAVACALLALMKEIHREAS